MTTQVHTLPDFSAIQCNRELMQTFERALRENPAADLLSLIPDTYRRKHETAQLQSLKTDAAKLDQRTLYELQVFLRGDPETNLLSVFPANYARRFHIAAQITGKQTKPKVEAKPLPLPDFRKRLGIADTATVVFPLSNNVKAILSHFSGSCGDAKNADSTMTLFSSLKLMLWSSPKLWESSIKGMVVKCNDNIVAKVLKSSNYTEYVTMQYLAETASEIPAPRPHGLIQFGPFCVMFMTYIPSMTLK